MDATQAEKANELARSLYGNRLAGSMDEAYKMAESILTRTSQGEEKTLAEIEKESPEVTTKAMNPEHDSIKRKLAALKRVVQEEEERIAGLKEELSKLKTATNSSKPIIGGIDAEVTSLAKDIDRAKDDVDHIREHIRDLEEIKHEIKDVEEAQEKSDTNAQEAEEIDERLKGQKFE